MVDGVWVRTGEEDYLIPCILVSKSKEFWSRGGFGWLEGGSFSFTTSGNFEKIAPGELAKW